ncbi:MAG: SGNH/GDSL hydrolase family protein [Dehalococcoidia bacterium]
MTDREPRNAHQESYLALGDSYTIGEGVAPDERWPNQLAAMLRAKGAALNDPHIIAQTGWTTGELLEAIAQSSIAGPFRLVSLLIGVNNQYRGAPLDQFRTEFARLLEIAVSFAGGAPGRVLTLSIPDWGVTPFAAGGDTERIAREIDQFNQVVRVEATRRGAMFVDVTGISRDPVTRAHLANDGLHPSGDMYRKWAEAARPFALAALSER